MAKCPNYSNSVNINSHIMPRVGMGIRAILKNDITKYLTSGPEGAILLTNKLTLSQLYPSGNRIGVLAYYGLEDVQKQIYSADDKWWMPSAALIFGETDLRGHLAVESQVHVTRNAQLIYWGQWGRCGSIMHRANGLVGYANHKYNVQLTYRIAQMSVQDNRVVVDNVMRFTDRLSAGLQLLLHFSNNATRKPDPSPLLKQLKPLRYEGLLRYENETTAMAATLNSSLITRLQSRRRLNDRSEVGLELMASLRDRMWRLTWMHRIQLDNGIVLKGKVDTDGMVAGNVFFNNLIPNLKLGICSLFNHRNNQVGLGVEIIFGADRPDDPSDLLH